MRGGNNERGPKEEHEVVRGGQKMLVATVGSTDRMTEDTVTSLTCIVVVCFEVFDDCFPDEFNPLKYIFFLIIGIKCGTYFTIDVFLCTRG